MITAGTVAAYLTVSAEDFNIGIQSAIKLLKEMNSHSMSLDAALGVLQGKLSTTGTSAQSLFTPMMTTAAQGVETAMNSMNQTAQSVLSAVESKFSSTAAQSSASAASMAASVSSASNEVSTKMYTVAGSMVSGGASIGSAMGSIAAATASAMASAVASIGTLKQAEPVAKANSESIKSAIVGAFGALSGELAGCMSNAGSSMASALAATKSRIVSVAQSIAASVTQTIQSALQIASPSKVMRRMGEFTGQGFALGISDTAPMIKESANRLALAAQTGAQTNLNFAAGVLRGRGESVGTVQTKPVADIDFGALSSRLDRLIELVSESEQVMKVDGRTFGKLIREYGV